MLNISESMNDINANGHHTPSRCFSVEERVQGVEKRMFFYSLKSAWSIHVQFFYWYITHDNTGNIDKDILFLYFWVWLEPNLQIISETLRTWQILD